MRERTVPSFAKLKPASGRASEAARASSKKRDTACELLLRRELTRLGLRYRIDAADLPGRPDVVFRRARVAVYCDGDFWHGRDLEARLERLARGHNAPYWIAKIRGNVARDSRNTTELEEAGWLVLRWWESDIKDDTAGIAKRIAEAVRLRTATRRGR